MKLLNTATFLTLAGTVLATPSGEREKRATCTFWAFTFPCFTKAVAWTKTSTTVAITSMSTSSVITSEAYTRTTSSSVSTTKAYILPTTSVFPTATSTTTSTSPIATSTATYTSPIATSTATYTSPTATSPSPSSGSGKTSYTSGDTASDIDNNTGCTPLTVIFARGTSESGNIGSVVGPPTFQQLISDLGASSLTLQGVNYPASTAGNADCGADGGADMANEVSTILARCPSTKVVLSGYSQGACVVHNAVQSQGLDSAQISGVVLFGDPFNGQSVGSVPSSNVLEICASGDDVCNGSGTYQITQAHLSYGSNAAQAAGFIESVTGV